MVRWICNFQQIRDGLDIVMFPLVAVVNREIPWQLAMLKEADNVSVANSDSLLPFTMIPPPRARCCL